MITSLRLVNFKNFADETLKVGPFTVIVGANASGKSNIRDAFRFLHGIGRGYTLAEIIGGKYGPAGQMEWLPIRGAPNELGRFGQADSEGWVEFNIETELELNRSSASYYFDSGFNPNAPEPFLLLEERLKNLNLISTLYEVKRPDRKVSSWHTSVTEGSRETRLLNMSDLSRGKPALTQLCSMEGDWYGKELVERASMALAMMRFLEPSPEKMREPSVPGAKMLGDFGQNLPTALEAICAEPDRERVLMSWLQGLTPMDVKGFEFPRDPSGRVHLQIVERNGRKVSAYSASDGTLRFLAILAALLSPNRGGIYFFEEIDAGIHPARLWLLLDFIEQETAKGDIQVITTTHSPALLTWMNDSTFEHTSVVYRDDYWSDSVIRPIADLYNLRELQKSRTLGELFTANWFGEAMKFSEGDPDTDHLDDDDEDVEERE